MEGRVDRWHVARSDGVRHTTMTSVHRFTNHCAVKLCVKIGHEANTNTCATNTNTCAPKELTAVV
jgi:hypothetical protein